MALSLILGLSPSPSAPALLLFHPRWNHMVTITNQLSTPTAALPRNSPQSPTHSLSPFHSLSQVFRTPPRQLRAFSLTWCPMVACVHSGDPGRAAGFSGSSCTHQLGVV